MQRRRLFNNAELGFASSRGLFRSDVKGRLPTSLCDPLGSPVNCPMGQTVVEANSPIAVAVAAAMKNGMGHSSPAVAVQSAVADQIVVVDQTVVADQYAVAAKQLFGTLESDQKPSPQLDVPIPGCKMAVVDKSDAEAQRRRSSPKMEFLEHHQDPPRRSINIRLRQNGTKVAVPITLTINVQLCRTRVPARRFPLRRAKPKVPATQISAPPWNLS